MGDGGPGGGVGVGEGSPTGPGLGSDAFGGTPGGTVGGNNGGFYGGWEEASMPNSGLPTGSRGGKDVMAANIALSAIPVIGPLLGLTNFAGKAKGDPNSGQGVSGPDGSGGVGGGPGEIARKNAAKKNKSKDVPLPVFKIDPNQVQKDLSQSFGQTQTQQMNPFSMYGSQMASPLDGGNYGANRYQQYANTGSPFPSFDWGSFFSGGK